MKANSRSDNNQTLCHIQKNFNSYIPIKRERETKINIFNALKK
jgi:hypothetical protein